MKLILSTEPMFSACSFLTYAFLSENSAWWARGGQSFVILPDTPRMEASEGFFDPCTGVLGEHVTVPSLHLSKEKFRNTGKKQGLTRNN
jgi:hypothetical protein